MSGTTPAAAPAYVPISASVLALALALMAGWPAAAWAQPGSPRQAAPPRPDTARARLLTTSSGVRYLVRELGTGPRPTTGNRVAVRYQGFLPDGHPFDATAASGGPLRFRVGRGEVIRGWDEVLPLLPAGSRARVWVPAALAYGPTGVPHPEDEGRYVIPPNTDLVFELQLVSVR